MSALAVLKMKVLVCVLALFCATLAAPNDRIVGGSNASRGEFPYIVSLQYCILGICQHSCGGSILTPRWVVTAAHCFTELPNIGSVSVLAGILNLNDDNVERQYISIASTIIHPNYQGGVNPNDIAVARLSSALILNTQVQPIAVPAPGSDTSGNTILSGWGSTGGVILPQMPNTLQRVTIPIVPIAQCDSALTSILNGAAHPLDLQTNVCTGPLTGGVSACSGDSGGPLVQNGELIGIVSWGITPCGSVGAPSVYVKVSSYIDWLQQNIDEPLTFLEATN